MYLLINRISHKEQNSCKDKVMDICKLFFLSEENNLYPTVFVDYFPCKINSNESKREIPPTNKFADSTAPGITRHSQGIQISNYG